MCPAGAAFVVDGAVDDVLPPPDADFFVLLPQATDTTANDDRPITTMNAPRLNGVT
jgi:hypothetical protein